MTVVVDLSDLKDLSQVLRRAAPEINRAFNSEIKGAVDKHVADRARARAAAWSTRVAGTIKSRRSGLTVYVDAGRGESKPHLGEAKAYEHNGVPGEVRHPVFGKWRSDVKYPSAHPMLGPALTAGGDGVMNDIANAVDKAITAVIR